MTDKAKVSVKGAGQVSVKSADILKSERGRQQLESARMLERIAELDELRDHFEGRYSDQCKINLSLHAKVERYEWALEWLADASNEARDDLLLRGEIGRGGERVVNMSATQWERFCDAIEFAAEQLKGDTTN